MKISLNIHQWIFIGQTVNKVETKIVLDRDIQLYCEVILWFTTTLQTERAGHTTTRLEHGCHTTNTGTNTHTHKWTQNCHNNQHEHKYAQTQTQINTQPTQHPTHQDLKVATTPHTAEALLSQVSEIFTIKTQISIFSFCIVFPKVPEAPAVHIDDVYITGILRYPHTHVCIKMSQENNVCSLCTGTAQRCSFYLIEK